MLGRKPVVAVPARRIVWRRYAKEGLKYLLAVAGVLVAVTPYLYMVLHSLAPWNEVNRRFIPTELTLRSYEWLLQGSRTVAPKPWLRALLNSAIVTAGSTFLMVVCGLVVGYALSRLRFRGQQTVYNIILFQMFYPAIVLLVPTFLIVRALGLYDTYWGMIVPKAVSLWAIFMFTSFFKSIPQDIIDAARIDGLSELGIVFRIALPMSIPITTVITLFLFMERWSELLWDLIIVQDENLMTLNVLIATMSGPYGNYPGGLYAASVILTLPILILFLIFSKYFRQGFQLVLK
ncbi:MAG: sugar ABC transporter permease [Bacillota bacterium]|nr:sugar ABC transporter permease [Bacillota bacterium]REJ33554.1 MAG: sugar ABC transporter permease [Bacillota bacterium]